jgi:hypothetical protein
MGAEVFGVGVRGMASPAMGSQQFNIEGDGWCLYKAYLTVFTQYRALPIGRQRTQKAIDLARSLGEIATAEDKAYIQRGLTSSEYDGLPIRDASGSLTGRFGFPSQLPADDGDEYIEVGEVHRKFITTADEYLRAIHTPIIDIDGSTQPEAWGSISLLHRLFKKFRPNIYFDVRYIDASGEADVNTGREMLRQEPLKHEGGALNISFLQSGPHYDVRIYISVDEDPLFSEAPVDEDEELIAATLSSLLLGSAAVAIENQSVANTEKLAGKVIPPAEEPIIRASRAPFSFDKKLRLPTKPAAEGKDDGFELQVQGTAPGTTTLLSREQLARSSTFTPRQGRGLLNRFGKALLASVPPPGGVEYRPREAVAPSGLFPRISVPSFDSTAIPPPRHRGRHPYRPFVAPPPPAPVAVAPRPARATDIPEWAKQHITEANAAADVKGVASVVISDVLAMQDYRGIDADPAYASYKADPKTRQVDSRDGNPAVWDELSTRYPDRDVLIRDASGTIHKYHVSNPFRAASYRKRPTFTFGNPAGLNPLQSVMVQQNLDVLNEIAPEEMIADTKFATALLESLWYCGSGHDIGGDPRCFPARVLGELREYKMFKDEKARAALAARARQYSEWNFIKGVLKKVRGQLRGTDVVGPVRVSGVPTTVPSAGPNLSARPVGSVAALAGRVAVIGPSDSAIIPAAAPASAPVASAAAVAEPAKKNGNAGPTARPRLRPLVRIPVAPPPSQLGAIGIIPQPPPNTFGAWGSRFRPIIPA